jgi:hypothetical protein
MKAEPVLQAPVQCIISSKRIFVSISSGKRTCQTDQAPPTGIFNLQIAVYPPSTKRSDAVTKLEASVAR